MENSQKLIWKCFDRHGGTSEEPYDSMNVGFYTGDDKDRVLINRQRIRQEIGADFLLSCHQVHGDRIFCLKKEIGEDLEVEGYDGVITNQKRVGLLIQQADCQAVLLHDCRQDVIGAIHCGWRGSVCAIIEKCIQKMKDDFSTRPFDITAVVSPSLGPCCAEFINYREELPGSFLPFRVGENYFDFWHISKKQLMDSGVSEVNISIVGSCTSCNEDFFSYRRAKRQGVENTGRNCSVIMLR